MHWPEEHDRSGHEIAAGRLIALPLARELLLGLAEDLGCNGAVVITPDRGRSDNTLASRLGIKATAVAARQADSI
jgi:hypothetical protein